MKIVENLNNIETLKFNFIQIAFDKKENGVCYLKRPHFLKCIYKDKNQKEIFVNRKNLVIYHKTFNKTYFYPVSKSFFINILDKKKFETLVFKGSINFEKDSYQIKYSEEDKGEIVFLFDKINFDLSGWEITDLNGNYTIFKIDNLSKNQSFDKKIFNIPTIN
tara:strand:+ start:1545 stop:2033 length:489 start_codon:yes stop_codon:yes gene_type:complete